VFPGAGIERVAPFSLPVNCALSARGVRAGPAVLVAHAEAYLPGRLSALAADAISEVLREDLRAATGRQALADRDVTLVIDGVSEVPTKFAGL
jgi:hypothetical protein